MPCATCDPTTIAGNTSSHISPRRTSPGFFQKSAADGPCAGQPRRRLASRLDGRLSANKTVTLAGSSPSRRRPGDGPLDGHREVANRTESCPRYSKGPGSGAFLLPASRSSLSTFAKLLPCASPKNGVQATGTLAQARESRFSVCLLRVQFKDAGG